MASERERDPARTRVVFLDFGGTLVAALSDMRPIYQEAARAAGVEVPWGRFLEEIGRTWEELWPTASTRIGSRPSFLDVVHARALERAGATGAIDRMVESIRDAGLSSRWHPPFPESEAVVRELRRRGYALHLLSNHTDWLPHILRNLGWAELFDGVTYSQEISAEKPDGRLFELALRRAGRPAGDALHVGDLWEADYRGARKAGIPALWLNRSGRDAPAPSASIRDLSELLPRLPQLGGSRRRSPSSGTARPPPDVATGGARR